MDNFKSKVYLVFSSAVFSHCTHESVWLFGTKCWWLEGVIIKSLFLNHHRHLWFVLCCFLLPSLRPSQSLGLQPVSQLTAVQPVLMLFASIIPELLVRVGVFTPRPEVSFDPRCPCQSFTLRSCAGCYIIPPSSRSAPLGPSARCGPPCLASINASPLLPTPASTSFNLDRLHSLESHTSRSGQPPRVHCPCGTVTVPCFLFPLGTLVTTLLGLSEANQSLNVNHMYRQGSVTSPRS